MTSKSEQAAVLQWTAELCCAAPCRAVLCCAALDTSKAAVPQWAHQTHRHYIHAIQVSASHLPGWQGISCKIFCLAEPQTLNPKTVLQSHSPGGQELGL